MGVIYCDQCSIGIHYWDLCPGGANGYPRKTKKQMRKEYRDLYVTVAVIMTGIIWLAVWIAGAPWLR